MTFWIRGGCHLSRHKEHVWCTQNVGKITLPAVVQAGICLRCEGGQASLSNIHNPPIPSSPDLGMFWSPSLGLALLLSLPQVLCSHLQSSQVISLIASPHSSVWPTAEERAFCRCSEAEAPPGFVDGDSVLSVPTTTVEPRVTLSLDWSFGSTEGKGSWWGISSSAVVQSREAISLGKTQGPFGSMSVGTDYVQGHAASKAHCQSHVPSENFSLKLARTASPAPEYLLSNIQIE